MEFLLNHFKDCQKLQIEDVFKFVYQATFGCSHIAVNTEKVKDYVKTEYETFKNHKKGSILLCDDFERVNFGIIDEGLSIETFASLVLLSAEISEINGKNINDLEKKLEDVLLIIKQKKLPFDEKEFLSKWDLWEQKGYPPVHHSDEFKSEYNPCYRVMSTKITPFLLLFSEIDKKLKQGDAVVAIEGGSASGKSTLGEILSKVYDLTLFHTDDFFLTPDKRTKERLSEVGGNLDRERFLREVLVPLSRKDTVDYKRFDCSSGEILPPIKKEYKKLTVVEGAYSMHVEFEKYYNLSAYLNIEKALQKKRIQKRNSPQMAKRFFEEWIPLEDIYFDKTDIKNRCDLTIEIKK